MLLLLQARGQLTAQQLADELEVSVRTIYRDVDSLSAAGIPVYAETGRAGGYRLVGGYRTRLTGLTAAEAEAMHLAAMPDAAAELGLGTVLAAARLKLQAAIPAELRERSARIQERFHLDAPGWYHDGDSSPYLAAIADAVWGQSVIRVRYRRWVAPTDVTRTLEPYGIVLKAGKWYLVAACDGGMRTYRVSQVLTMTDLGEQFERRSDFDLPAYWAAHVSRFRLELTQGEATIRLSPAGRGRLADLMSSTVVSAVDATATAPDVTGWVTAVVPIESLQHAQSAFLSLAAEVEILAPEALRSRIAEAAQSLAQLYGRAEDRLAARWPGYARS
jgi:predicted DNA-binding transcriptional regulator YafY